MSSLNNSIRQLEKDLAKKSLRFFAMTYFKHYCTCSFAPFQLALFDYLTDITLKRGNQIAIAAPRGNAKSSLVSLMYERLPFIPDIMPEPGDLIVCSMS